MSFIDRTRVRHAFERHAMEYDQYAWVQKRVVKRVMEILRDCDSTPLRVLDIGAGTGMLLSELANRYPFAKLVGLDLAHDMGLTARGRGAGGSATRFVTADGELLPFADGAFDLVVSTSTFQWLDTLDAAFTEVFRVLRPGGTFNFALFGEKTLFELKESYRAACRTTGRGGEDRPQTFFTSSDVELALKRCGFHRHTVQHELEQEMHPDVPALIRSLKRIGAGNPSPVASKGLSERRVMIEMMNIYRECYAVSGAIPATYEVIYGRAAKF